VANCYQMVANSNANGRLYPDFYTHGMGHANAKAFSHARSTHDHSHCDPTTHRKGYVYLCRHGNLYQHGYKHTNVDRYSHADGYSYRDKYTNLNANEHGHSYCYRDEHTNLYANRDTTAPVSDADNRGAVSRPRGYTNAHSHRNAYRHRDPDPNTNFHGYRHPPTISLTPSVYKRSLNVGLQSDSNMVL